ncbi:MAG: hypothetical protein GXO80_03835 [Chlorobi bacterium]|nr:hypothetical protein [Chlorobiota bacterium]
MIYSFSKLFILCALFTFIKSITFAQLSYRAPVSVTQKTSISNIAYKLPYRGENYKFYGTLKFHISGKAYVNNKVYNSFIEAQHLSEQNLNSATIRLLKASGKKYGYLNPHKESVCGNRLVFLCPMTKKEKPLKFYYRTGLFRYFYRFNSSGISKSGRLCIDFETLARYLLNLDNAANFFGLQIRSVTIKRSFIKLKHY